MPLPRPAAYDPQRPRLQADGTVAVALAEPSADAPGGRWRAYDGGPLTLCVWGLNMQADPSMPGWEWPEPVTVYAELASVRFHRDRLSAYWEHCEDLDVGSWSGLTASEQGIDGDLTVHRPKNEAERLGLDPHHLAARVRAWIERDHPMELSVGLSVAKGDIHELAAGETAVVNGRQLTGAQPGEPPVMIWRNAVVDEISVVHRGACAQTRRLAAALYPQWLRESGPGRPPAITPPPHPTQPPKGSSMTLTAKLFASALILLAGPGLGGLVSGAIDAEVARRRSDAGDDADEAAIRSTVLGELETATGVSADTVAQIAAGEIDAPSDEVKAGLTEVLGITPEQIDEAIAADSGDGEEAQDPPASGQAGRLPKTIDPEVAQALAKDPRCKGHEAEVLQGLAAGKSRADILLDIQERRLAKLEAKSAGAAPGDEHRRPVPGAGARSDDEPALDDYSGSDDDLKQRYQASAALQAQFPFGVDSYVAYAKRERRLAARRR